jgi:alpha-N-arabinofuranosidase
MSSPTFFVVVILACVTPQEQPTSPSHAQHNLRHSFACKRLADMNILRQIALTSMRTPRPGCANKTKIAGEHMTRETNSGIDRRIALQGTLTAGLAAALPAQALAAPALAAQIDATQTGAPITKYTYGALIEHIGGLINTSLWAEALDDRKFFYPVNSQPVPAGARPGSRGPGRKWTPMGPDAGVTMDTANAYAGEHSPVMTLAGSTPRGIQQTGISLANKGYSGRIVIAGDAGTRVTVALIWGPGASDRQSIDIPVKKEWATVPLRFAPRAATTEARMEIAGTGTGTFRVGAVSLMPDDNLKGFRADTIGLLKAMNSGFYRLPGGNFVSGHDWRDAIGDPDKRPPIYDPAWHVPQPNDVGTDELMTLCDLLGVEPYLCVDTGYGSAREGAQLVEYCNGSASTRMGAMRATNGHPEPYKVKYWNVGNEMYGYWQMGYMAPEHYMIKHNLFAKAMRKVDPSITIIAVGAMPDEMTVDECPYFIDPHTRKVVGKTVVDFGSPNDWTYRLLKDCSGNFDVISEHCYGDAHRFDIQAGKILPEDVKESVLDSCRRAPNRIRLKREYWEQYKKAFPYLNEGKIKVSVDEWGFRNAKGLKQTLGFAMTLHELFRNTDFITMAAFTMGMSWIDYNRTDSVYSNAGLLFQMYNRNFGDVPVPIAGNTPQPAPKWPVGGDQPQVNAGSPTWPLDMAAALKNNGSILTVAVVNATEMPQQTSLALTNFAAKAHGRVWRLTGPNLDAANQVGKPVQVAVKETTFNATSGKLSVMPYSVELYEFTKA